MSTCRTENLIEVRQCAANAARDPSRISLILLSNGFAPEYESGFSNGLADAGYAPLLIGSDNTLMHRLRPGVRVLNLRGSQAPDRALAAKVLNMLRYWRSYLQLVRRHPGATVHVIGLFSLRNSLTNLLEAFLLRRVVRRFVLTVHNLLPHDASNWLNRRIFRLLYRLPDVLVVHTHGMKRELNEQFYVPIDRIVVMEHGIDQVAKPPEGAGKTLRQRLGIGDNRPVVLFFGAIAPYKGLDLLIRAFEALPPGSPDAVLVVAGYCRDGALRDRIASQIRPLIEQRRAIHLDGYVPEAEVMPLFHGSDLLVLPYRHIDQSGVIFMALATGLPVLATEVGSLSEYSALTGGATVPPNDAAALGAAIARLLERTKHIDRDQVVSEAAQRFLWRHTVQALAPIYPPTK